MDIISLKIDNFLAIGNAPTVFLKNKGLVLIQGVNEDDTSATSNGVGKSSIADALCWALYGQTARDESGDAVVNNVAKKGCSVAVTLHDGDTEYVITRHRKHKEFKNSTIITGRSMSSGITSDLAKGTEKETQEVINAIMGCTLDVFMGAIYAGQEVAPDLPKMTDKQLKLLIEEAAGVERLEIAYEIARKKLLTAKEIGSRTQATLEGVKSNLEASKLDLAKTSLEVETFDKGRAGRAAAFTDAAKTHKTALVSFLTSMKGIDTEELNKRNSELGRALAGHSELQRQLAKLKADHANAIRLHDRATIAHEANMRAVQSAKLKLDNAATEISKPCNECGKPGSADDLEAYKAVINKRLVELIGLAKETKAALSAAVTEATAKANEVSEFEPTIPDVSEMTAEQAKINASLRDYADLRYKAGKEKSEFERENERAEAALVEVNPHASAVTMLEGRIAKLVENVAQLNSKYLTDEANTAVFENVAKVFSPAGVRAHILDTVTPFLNDRTTDYLSALSDGNISAVWTTLSPTAKGDLKEKFCIEVANEKGAKSFKGLSGGEKRKVRLSTMLALQDLVASRATKPINLWLGDEIDDALDTAGLERLMTILDMKARERGTVLVISHNDLNAWVDQAVTVTKREGLSTIEGVLCH